MSSGSIQKYFNSEAPNVRFITHRLMRQIIPTGSTDKIIQANILQDNVIKTWAHADVVRCISRNPGSLDWPRSGGIHFKMINDNTLNHRGLR